MCIKHLLRAIFISVMALTVALPVVADNITVGGKQRTYIKYVPNELGDNRPLLISMHGMNQDANYQKGMLQIESIADTAKFAVVFPEGLNRSWDISGNQDINFVLAVIDDMKAKHNIDVDRVYLSGFSMGGMFTYHAMNHIADRIAAFAPISGYPMGGQPFTSSRPVPIIHTHGTGDDVVDFGGVQRSLNGWIERNGCSMKSQVTNNYRTWIATRHQWGPGDEGAEVVLLELADKGHWISNDGFYTGEEIWNFCKRYSLNVDLPKVNFKYPLTDTEYMTLGASDQFKIHFEVDATSATSEIDQVNIYCDKQLVGQVDEGPYVYDWTDAVRGTHFIKAEAVDKAGVSCARAIPVDISVIRNNINLSKAFTADGILPSGWYSYDGRSSRVGPQTGLTARTRVIKFTGSPRDFDYGMYIVNVSGSDEAYAAYAATESRASLYMVQGNYELSFDACNYNMPGGGDIICQVCDNETGDVLAECTVHPTLNLNKSTSDAFTGSTHVVLTFSINEGHLCSLNFGVGTAKGNDAVIGNLKLVRKGDSGIVDVVANQTQPVSVIYYDIMGRSASEGATGLVIRRAVLEDGSVVTEKCILK